MTAHNRKAGNKRLVDMSAGRTEQVAWEPDLPKVDTYEQVFPIGETAAYIQRLDLDERGRIVEWAVIQTCKVGNRVQRVAVYDICHDKGVHVHYYDRDERQFAEEPLARIASYRDLEEGLDYAVQRVSEAWRENERRSARGY